MLALPVILAGIRVAVVSAVAIAAIGAKFGAGGLGVLLFEGIAQSGRIDKIAIGALGLAALKAVLALGVVLYAGQRPMRWWFSVVARQRSHELFMLNLLLVSLGLAALTEAAGLSLALGAFLAGMLIAETEFRYQV